MVEYLPIQVLGSFRRTRGKQGMMVVFLCSHISGQCMDEIKWEMGWREGSRREEGRGCLGMESQKVQEPFPVRSEVKVSQSNTKTNVESY